MDGIGFIYKSWVIYLQIIYRSLHFLWSWPFELYDLTHFPRFNLIFANALFLYPFLIAFPANYRQFFHQSLHCFMITAGKVSTIVSESSLLENRVVFMFYQMSDFRNNLPFLCESANQQQMTRRVE